MATYYRARQEQPGVILYITYSTIRSHTCSYTEGGIYDVELVVWAS